MNNKDYELIYNDDYCVIIPGITESLLKAFEYTFKNVFLMNSQSIEKTFELLKNSVFKKIILVDYQIEYEKILAEKKEKTEIIFLYTGSLANFTSEFDYMIFKSIFKLYEETENSKLALLDKGLYNTLKVNHDNIYYIMLDTPIINKEKANNSNTIGILNDENIPVHSFYNELTAVKLIDDSIANIKKCNKTTKSFMQEFNIISQQYKTIEEVMLNSDINLYINFTKTNSLLFLNSMDLGIPCILGNTELLDNNEYLKKMLVMKSDDDVNEMAEKIINAKKEKNRIISEYKKFRSNYCELVRKNKEILLEKTNEEKNNKKYEKLLSVIVPVYNTEKYLRNSLNSIISAAIDDMEVLIINDGSTDNSEEIIKEYEKKYPEIIRYIKKKNGGLGSVRNVGLQEAKGKYLASVDSDDTINSKFFKEAEEYLKDDIDIVLYDWLSINENKETFETPAIEWTLKEKGKYEGLLYSSIMPSTCNKIMKKSIIDDLGLKYIEDKYEDLSLNPIVMLKSKRIKYIPKPYYEYYLRSGSLMRTSAGYSMINIIKELNDRIETVKDSIIIDINEFKYYTFSWRIEEYIINQLYTIKNEEIDDYIKEIYKNVYSICLELFDSIYYQNMLNKLSGSNKKSYIEKRNMAFKNKRLKEFIINAKKEDNIEKITSLIVYFGE